MSTVLYSSVRLPDVRSYRLNAFGFPNSDAVKQKNLGLLDQRLAIEWLRDNIRAFGGDPARISLMGHSAGSISIGLYSYHYVDDPIVSALIELSGQPGLLPSDDGSAWKSILNATGCGQGYATDELACLRKLHPRQIKRAISPRNILDYGDLSGGSITVDNVGFLPLEEYSVRGRVGKFSKLVREVWPDD